MKEELSKAGLKDIPVDWLQEVDSDGSVQIDYTEVLAATLDRIYGQKDVCWSEFRVFDSSGDGKISMEELQQVLPVVCARDVAEVVGLKAIAEMLLEVDGKADGFIDFKEFSRWCVTTRRVVEGWPIPLCEFCADQASVSP